MFHYQMKYVNSANVSFLYLSYMHFCFNCVNLKFFIEIQVLVRLTISAFSFLLFVILKTQTKHALIFLRFWLSKAHLFFTFSLNQQNNSTDFIFTYENQLLFSFHFNFFYIFSTYSRKSHNKLQTEGIIKKIESF